MGQGKIIYCNHNFLRSFMLSVQQKELYQYLEVHEMENESQRNRTRLLTLEAINVISEDRGKLQQELV